MRFFLILPLFLLLAQFSTAQQGTTLEEYRYLTKGYAYQKGMGLDATKEGYTFSKLYTASNKVEFVGMYRDGKASPQAILCVFDKGLTDNSFLCLPNNDSAKDIMELYEQDRKGILSYERRKAFDKALVELLFHQMSPMAPDLVSNIAVPPSDLIPTSYEQSERLTPKGIAPQPLVASSPTAPSYPVNRPGQTSTRPSAPSTTPAATTIPIPRSYDAPPAQAAPPAQPYDYLPKSGRIIAKDAPRSTNLRVNTNLYERPLTYQPSVITNTKKKGKVVVKICVNASGEVTSAKFTQRGSTSLDNYLRQLAEDNAHQLRFAPNQQVEQCGTITYIFNL